MSSSCSPPEAGSSVDPEGTCDGLVSPLKTGCEENQQLMDGPEVREGTLDGVQHQMSCVEGPVQKDHLRRAIAESSVDPEKLLKFLQVFNGQQSRRVKGKNSSFSWISFFVSTSLIWISFFGSTSLSWIRPVVSTSLSWIRPVVSTSLSWIRPVVKVFLHVSGTTCGAHQVILDKLEKLQSWSWRLEVTGDWQESDLFLVFCPAMTRPGADVEATMRKLPGDKPVLLVVMYHTLHEDHSSDLRRWSDRYENVVCEVDVLFHETVPGLLKCPQNNGAIKQIEETLKEYSKRR